jgi:hypothetical protein
MEKEQEGEILNNQTPIEKENALPFSDYQSVKHFCILCILSFGLYPFFWFFKHWQYLRDENGLNINPSFRTMFTLFYGYSLFNEFEVLAIQKGYKKNLPLPLLFMLFFILAITAALRGSTIVLFSFFAFLPLVPIHLMINFYYLNVQAGYPIRNKLSKGEKRFLSCIWLILLALIVLQLF